MNDDDVDPAGGEALATGAAREGAAHPAAAAGAVVPGSGWSAR